MSEKIVLMLNLGSPNAPTKREVQRYLNQFLMDPDVIDLPWIVRRLLVSLLIIPFRSSKSAHAYSSVWTDQGTPLLVNSAQLRQAVQRMINVPIYMAMRYGSPSIEQTLCDIHQQHPQTKELIVLPLYPHYAASTVKSCKTELARVMQRFKFPFAAQMIPPFFKDNDYIHSLVECAHDFLQQPYDHLLFSYHGIPERHITKADPTGEHCLKPKCCETHSPAHKTCYRYHVMQTTKAFVQATGLTSDQYTVTFQSRLGKAKWLQPYTAPTLISLAQKGVKRLLVICPSFTADCLETLEEIGIQGRQTFINAGGKDLTLLPCLNKHETWVKTVAHWIQKRL